MYYHMATVTIETTVFPCPKSRWTPKFVKLVKLHCLIQWLILCCSFRIENENWKCWWTVENTEQAAKISSGCSKPNLHSGMSPSSLWVGSPVPPSIWGCGIKSPPLELGLSHYLDHGWWSERKEKWRLAWLWCVSACMHCPIYAWPWEGGEGGGPNLSVNLV